MNQTDTLTLTALGIEIVDRTDLDIELLMENQFQEQLYGRESDDGLARSLREDGQIEAVLVWQSPVDSTRFEIVSGHRRTWGARALGWTTIRADVARYIDDAERRLRIVIAANATTRVRTNAELVNEMRALGGFSSISFGDDTAITSSDNISEPPGGLGSILPPQQGRSSLAELLRISLDTVDRVRFVYDEEVRLSALLNCGEPGLSIAGSAWDDVRYDCRHGLGFREGQKRIQRVLDEVTALKVIKRGRKRCSNETPKGNPPIACYVLPERRQYQVLATSKKASFGLADGDGGDILILDYNGRQYAFEEEAIVGALVRMVPRKGLSASSL